MGESLTLDGDPASWCRIEPYFSGLWSNIQAGCKAGRRFSTAASESCYFSALALPF
jgi:hypothetical protein